MIAAILLLALAASPPPARVEWCESLGSLAVATNDARSRGITQEQAEAAANALDTADARQAGNTVIWYVYTANSDGRVSSTFLGAQVRRACLAKGEEP